MTIAIISPNNDSVDLSWGSESLCLHLPGFEVCFSGLSHAQKNQLELDYAGFELSAQHLKQANKSTKIVCEVRRLDEPVNIPMECLTRDGQYTPIKQRVAGGVQITGMNFKAYFDSGRECDSQAWVGVAREHEFSQAIVVENFLRIYAAHNAISHHGALLHSAGLVFNQQAYIFVGRSGVGKTTLTRKAHAVGATVLSDDINLIMPSFAGFDAYKVPFTGEFGRTVDHLNVAKSFPLKAVVLLQQGESIEADFATASFAVSRLLAGSPFVNTDEHEVDALFEIYTNLTSKLPVITLAIPYESEIYDIITPINQLIDGL